MPSDDSDSFRLGRRWYEVGRKNGYVGAQLRQHVTGENPEITDNGDAGSQNIVRAFYSTIISSPSKSKTRNGITIGPYRSRHTWTEEFTVGTPGVFGSVEEEDLDETVSASGIREYLYGKKETRERERTELENKDFSNVLIDFPGEENSDPWGLEYELETDVRGEILDDKLDDYGRPCPDAQIIIAGTEDNIRPVDDYLREEEADLLDFARGLFPKDEFPGANRILDGVVK